MSAGELNDLAVQKLAARDFGGYLGLFGSHKRLRPFLSIETQLTDKEYWPLLRKLWTMAEIFLPDAAIWAKLLECKRKFRRLIMNEAERTKLESMPGNFKVYRGYCHLGGEAGYSWTLSKAKARQFAEYATGGRRAMCGADRFNGQFVAFGTVNKDDVIAYFQDRSEKEIVVAPGKVHGIEVEVLYGKRWCKLTDRIHDEIKEGARGRPV